jgi:TM2 domain-containing membrane protein YozV
MELATSAIILAQNFQTGEAAAGLMGSLACCVFGLLGIGVFVFWLWMLIDCVQREFPGPNDKVIWIIIIVLLSWVGALIYFFVGRPKGRKN